MAFGGEGHVLPCCSVELPVRGCMLSELAHPPHGSCMLLLLLSSAHQQHCCSCAHLRACTVMTGRSCTHVCERHEWMHGCMACMQACMHVHTRAMEQKGSGDGGARQQLVHAVGACGRSGLTTPRVLLCARGLKQECGQGGRGPRWAGTRVRAHAPPTHLLWLQQAREVKGLKPSSPLHAWLCHLHSFHTFRIQTSGWARALHLHPRSAACTT